jgi:hypothetical protein
MIARTVTVAALAAALGLSACPAEPTGAWGIIANGTQLNGLALQRVTSGSIRLQEREEDEPNCEEWICGANGTSFNGIALRGVSLDGIRMRQPEDDHADALGGGTGYIRSLEAQETAR